jgi:hypothetical protein
MGGRAVLRTTVFLVATLLCVGAGTAVVASAPTAGFTDNFDNALDTDPGYGLNDGLVARQQSGLSSTYTRVSGLPGGTTAPRPWFSQVDHVNHPGTLSFFLGTSAVRLDKPVIADSTGTVSIAATLDPVTQDTASPDWNSLVLSPNASSTGYVTAADASLGVLVRSNGALQAFQKGTLLAALPTVAPAADGSFQVSVRFTPGATTATYTVNGVASTVHLASALPAKNTLFLGALLPSTTETSTVDNLAVSAVDDSAQPAVAALRYYGYYAARLTNAGGDNIPEAAGRSNLNWVNISDPDAYRPEVLNSCAPSSCVVYTGNEFFSCDSTGMACHLYSDYAARWQNLVNAVMPYQSRIAAFYLLDEPQFRGATSGELQTAAQTIKATFPTTKIMMVEAGPAVTPSLVVPSDVDWVGFDWYCKPIATISTTLKTLESRMSAGQSAFLLPEDAPLAECGGAAGHATDADIAALQHQYFTLAAADPRVIGLMNFGFWTSQDWTDPGAVGVSSLPQTLDSNEREAARILLPN